MAKALREFRMLMIRRKLPVSAVALIVCIIAVATLWGYRNSVHTDELPRAEIMGDSDVALGRVTHGQGDKKVSFAIKNAGKSVLQILSYQTSCKCNNPRLDRATLAPGEYATLTFSVPVPSQAGAFKVLAAVTTSDPKNSIIRFSATGFAELGCTSDPALVTITGLFRNGSVDSTVRVLGPTNHEDFAVFGLENPVEGISLTEISQMPVTTNNRKQYAVRLTIFGRASSYWEESLTFRTNAPDMPLLTIPLHVKQQSVIEIAPPIVVVHPGKHHLVEVKRIDDKGALEIHEISRPSEIDVTIERNGSKNCLVLDIIGTDVSNLTNGGIIAIEFSDGETATIPIVRQ